MTPQARLSAAIDILDRILAGTPAEQALTNWGRASRFAGSGDRHALRDLVFEALRCKRSFAAMGGAQTGRGLMLGWARAQGADVASLFTGVGHAPAALQDNETGRDALRLEALDCPDWLAPKLEAALGNDFSPVMQALRHRAPVFLRVNQGKTTLDAAMAALRAEGIVAAPHPLARFALEVTENARKIQNSQVYLNGLVELQDAASQAVVDALPLRAGQRVLDYCCGGGGKALAMAAAASLQMVAHDADPRRLRDLPARAARAGVTISIKENFSKSDSYDVILTDVPCSGSGSWRRDPQGKWALTQDRLDALCAIQQGILETVPALLAPAGVLAYATCSVLNEENELQISSFLNRNPGWRSMGQKRFSPLQGGDGFFLALLTRAG